MVGSDRQWESREESEDMVRIINDTIPLDEEDNGL
jgi:hypothetical protein